MKKIEIRVFSATGNTMKLAQALAESLRENNAEAKIEKIEDGTEQTEDTEDTLVVMYPVHGFNTPMNVIRFCRKLPEGKGRDAYVVKSSGEPLRINDDSSGRLIRLFKKKGYAFKGEYHYIMPYNMIFRHSDAMAAKMYITAKERIPNAAKEIAESADVRKKIPFKAKLVAFFVSIEHWGARFNGRFFHVKKDKCIRCMKCVRNCPVQNIRYEDGKFKFGKECLLCTRCSFQCPTDAFRIGLMDFMRVNGKYDFNADPSEAKIGKYWRKSYKRYFGEE